MSALCSYFFGPTRKCCDSYHLYGQREHPNEQRNQGCEPGRWQGMRMWIQSPGYLKCGQFSLSEGTTQVEVTISGEVKQITQDKRIKLYFSKSFRLTKNETIVCHQLMLTNQGYILFVTGLNGEPVSNHPVSVDIKVLHVSSHWIFQHKWLCTTNQFSLQTNQFGQIQLGSLKDVESIKVSLIASGHSPSC